MEMKHCLSVTCNNEFNKEDRQHQSSIFHVIATSEITLSLFRIE